MKNRTTTDRVLPFAGMDIVVAGRGQCPIASSNDNSFHENTDNNVSRSEVKYEVFRNDLPCLLAAIEDSLPEIDRPHRSTATIHFHDRVSGAPSVDFGCRLRGYGELDPASPDVSALNRMPWQFERKCKKTKTRDGIVRSLADVRCGDTGKVFVNGDLRSLNTLKVVERRHFALGSRQDEQRRLTTDLSRSLYRFDGEELRFLGDMGPRIELKTPRKTELPSFLPAAQDVLHDALPFGSLYFYMQNVLRSQIRKDSFDHLGELELKFMVKNGRAHDLLFPVLTWMRAHTGSFQLLLPDPRYMCRMRRYHVCEASDPGVAATIVETPAGRCSLKAKRNAHSRGATLIRETAASHTTDIDGNKTDAAAFARAHQLRRINSFVKTQSKVPFHLRNGLAFQISLDECTDTNGRILNQLELEFIGDVTGKRPRLSQVLSAMTGLSAAISKAPFAGALRPTAMCKHRYFAEAA